MAEYLLLHVPEELKLSKTQLQTIVDISVGTGLVGFGSIAIPAFVENGNVFQVFTGLIISIGSWYTAIRIARLIE